MLCANSAWNLVNFRGAIIAALVAANHRVIAAAAPDGSEARLVALGAEFRELRVEASGRNPIADARYFLALVQLLKKERPAALLTFTVKPNIYGPLAAGLTGTRALATISGLGSAFLAGGPTGRLVDWLYWLGLARADAVFFQNSEDRALFIRRRLIKAEQARQVPGSGVDLSYFSPAALPGNRHPVFLFVGRLLWDKGLGELVEASRLLRRRGYAMEVRLVGECGVKNPSSVTLSEVRRWEADGFIRYLGPSDDVRREIAAADCVVLPSYREGVPRSLLEGAAMARPLIATDVPGCRDVIEHELNGFLCAPQSASSLADQMARMADLSAGERQEMGREGRQKIEREFAVERVIEAYRAELGI